MALPNNKQQLADWILRRLGAPMVNVEIADVQLEDVIDEAVQFFQEYHYDGAERTYRVIKIEGDVLTGNNRRHQNLNAPQYNPALDSHYRKGDRVMTYKGDGTPDAIWIRYDSEEKVNYVYYLYDSEGNYFVYDSDVAYADFRMLNMTSADSEARNHTDSDGLFVVYDSDKHNIDVYKLAPITKDSDVAKLDSDYRMFVDSEKGIYQPLFVDSDSSYVLYDSDKHISYTYDSDINGIWVRTDSDSDTMGWTLYDSDLHTKNTYVIDPTGLYVDSDGSYVLYDSDKHVTFAYESDSAGIWVDSDGVWSIYRASTWSFTVYDSDGYVTDSEGRTFRMSFDSEGALKQLYVKIGNQFVQYDSDTHSPLFYDSDGAGNLGNFVVGLERLYFKHYKFYSVQRFTRYSVQPNRFSIDNAFVPQKYTRKSNNVFYIREHSLIGKRVEQFWDSDLYRRSLESYGWEDLWVREDIALTEPTVDYDYTKTGQVGIPVPDTIIGINKVFRIDNFSGMGMWNYEYQYFLNNFDFFYGNSGASSQPMTNYYITKSYLDLIDHLMNVQPAIRFNKHRNRLYIDTNWTRLNNMAKSRDYYLMIECYEVNDPEIFGDVYKDKWLKRYATALAKMQWGTNLKKYSNTELPGGLVIDGQALYDEGKEEAQALEEELKNTQLEMDFIIG